MGRLKFGLETSVYPASDLVKSGILAEKYGFDFLWTPDHLTDVAQPGDKADPWTILPAVGVQTKRIMLGTMTDTQRIHPAKTASIVATLDELTGGRAVLGIGAGERMNLTPYGLPFEAAKERTERLGEAVQVIGHLWRSDRENRANFDGKYYKLVNAQIDQRPVRTPPIYVGALGARGTLEIAGKYADGWFAVLNSLDTFSRRLSIVDEARRKAGRNREPFDAMHTMHAAITEKPEDRKKAIDSMKIQILTLNNRSVLQKMGFDFEIEPDVEYSYQKVTDDGGIPLSLRKVAKEMPDEVAEQFVFVGNASEAIEYVDRFSKSGATQICLLDVLGLSIYGSLQVTEETMKVFSQKVFPYFS